MPNQCHGSLFIVAAPSGGGKTSLVKKLLSSLENIEVSISHTTRSIRPRETHGVDYFFIDQSHFVEMIAKDEFVEHAQVFNSFYGTSQTQIHDRLQKGIDIVLDIDWQGAQQIKLKFPDAVGIFILPPSLSELKSRLLARQQDDESVIALRMQQAKEELSHYNEFEYLIVNDNFEQAAEELKAIVLANRLQLAKQSKKQEKLLSFLLSAQ